MVIEGGTDKTRNKQDIVNNPLSTNEKYIFDNIYLIKNPSCERRVFITKMEDNLHAINCQVIM